MGWDAEDAEAAWWADPRTEAEILASEPDPNDEPESWVDGELIAPVSKWNDGFEPDDYDQDDQIWHTRHNTTGDKIMSTASELRKLIEQAQTELAKLEARPAEPFSETTHMTIVVMFRFQYDGRGKTYGFAAIRTNQKWYVTGNGAPGRGISWSDLWEWIEGSGRLVGPMMVAERWADLTP